MTRFEQYVGIEHGQYNCLQLVKLVLEREFGKTLDVPSHQDLMQAHQDAYPVKAGAERTDTPDTGDVVLFDRKPYAHVGILIGGGYVLHSLEDRGSEIQPLSVLRRWLNIQGYYKGKEIDTRTA